MNNTFLTLIIEAPVVDQLRMLASSWSGGEGMWKTALTTDGTTVSHYISSGYIYGTIADYLPYKEYATEMDEEGNVTTTINEVEGDLQGIVDLVAEDTPEAGLTIGVVEALLPYVDSSTQQPREAMARLGVSLYTVEEEGNA